jgi:hypothetical protein
MMGAEASLEVRALLALWNDVDPIHDVAYNDWHANEHVPERLTVPGMLFGLRFRTMTGVPGPRYLTLYGLRDVQVLDSAAYQHLLAWPTPMSARMRHVMHHISRAVYDVQLLQGRLDLPCLSVREGQGEEPAPMLDPVPAGCLQGLRRADTQPLPWVQAGQTGAAGDQERAFMPPAKLWLIAREKAEPGAAGVLDYRRLPVADVRSTG